MIRSSRPVLAFAALVTVASGLLFLGSAPARASHVTCLFQFEQWNVIAHKDNGVNRGVGSWGPGMDVIDSDHNGVPCERVSSLFMFGDFNNYLELGWYEVPQDVYACINDYPPNTAPRRLVLYRVNGIDTCAPGTNIYLDPAQNHGFRIQNDDANNFFGYYHNDQWVYSSVNMGFPFGEGWANTERTTAGTAFGDFKRLYHQTGTGWFNWNSSSQFCDTDPGYKPVKNANDWWTISAGSNSYVSCSP